MKRRLVRAGYDVTGLEQVFRQSRCPAGGRREADATPARCWPLPPASFFHVLPSRGRLERRWFRPEGSHSDRIRQLVVLYRRIHQDARAPFSRAAEGMPMNGRIIC